MPKIKKCKECNKNLLRAYIRLNTKETREWYAIGYYCLKCEVLTK